MRKGRWVGGEYQDEGKLMVHEFNCVFLSPSRTKSSGTFHENGSKVEANRTWKQIHVPLYRARVI